MNPNMSTSPSSIPTYIQSLLPTALHPWVSLSYPVAPPHASQTPLASKLRPATSWRHREVQAQPLLYGQGPKDVYFVVFCALAFTLLREVTMRYVMSTFARGWLKRSRRKERENRGEKVKPMTKLERRKMEHVVTRFAEQGWSFLYCTVFWSLGVVSGVIREMFVGLELIPVRPVPLERAVLARDSVGLVPEQDAPVHHQVLLPRAAGLVVPPAVRDQHGEAPRRPLADVRAPHLDDHALGRQLRRALYPRRHGDSQPDGPV